LTFEEGRVHSIWRSGQFALSNECA
jgi:hypothetical protein